jgi:hypothetical protein
VKKKLSYILVAVVALLSFSSSALAQDVKQNSDSLQDKASLAAGVTYSDLKVSYSTYLMGSSWRLVSGAGIVSLDSYGRVTGLKPGDATIYAYDQNGNHYWTHYFHVIR